MKKILVLICLILLQAPSYASEYIFIDKCSEPYLTCLANKMKKLPYAQKIYSIVCTPYYSSFMNNREPLFLKVVNVENPESQTLFDEYEYKTSEIDIVRYI